jgi:hypothetical protein
LTIQNAGNLTIGISSMTGIHHAVVEISIFRLFIGIAGAITNIVGITATLKNLVIVL